VLPQFGASGALANLAAVPLRSLLIPVCVAALAAPALADVGLSAVFGDGAVLQRDRPIPVWGWDEPGTPVTVTLAGRSAAVRTGADGRWRATLPALGAGGPHTLAVSGSSSIAYKNVLVGDVWLCSGQSNMALPVHKTTGAAGATPTADLPRVRMLTVRVRGEEEPQDDCRAGWSVCSPKTVGLFSGVAFYFGRELHREVGVPIGLLHSSAGGTAAEPWMPLPAVADDPALARAWKPWKKRIEAYDPAAAEAAFQRKLADWKTVADAARAAGTRVRKQPVRSRGPRAGKNCPGALWNGMVAPLVPYGIRGVIWYQGESNAPRAHDYRVLFPALIRSWRDAWDDAELPFLFVQLAAFGQKPKHQTAPSGGPSTWSELREAQLMAHRAVPHTGMAVAIDVGDVQDPHPRNKREVGRRLALWALRTVYGRDAECSGPLYLSAAPVDKALRITFDHAGGLRTTDDKPPAGFAAAGEDGAFVPAAARIDGETLVVTRPDGGPVVHVRYAWSDAPVEPLNLVNAAGLPASPFRTDNLRGVTTPRE